MKKAISLFCILALLFSFGACASRAPAAGPAQPQDGALRLRIVDGAGTDLLVLAGETGGVYTVVTDGRLKLSENGETADVSELENGMILSFGADCQILETWPAQIAGGDVLSGSGADILAEIEPLGNEDHGDLCGLYLQVLEDLWTEDSGLNGDIAYISVDLSGAPGGLTDGEKAAVAWIFANRHGAQALQLGYEELKANGYLQDAYYWEDGVLFSIEKAEKGTNSEKKITFDAEKWRSGLGALFFNGCTAKRGAGVRWEAYKVGEFAIS
ncbi:MAG: hypothetical protein IJK23_13310 [Clostridia bacterium]|nr:hypothetical protein [Clostridia bacterium]